MFGFDLWDAGLVPSMLIALLGGMLSFVSPCVLPIVPPYLAYMGGVTMDEMMSKAMSRRRTVFASFSFVFGLSTIFILLGLTASTPATSASRGDNLKMKGRSLSIAGLIIIFFFILCLRVLLFNLKYFTDEK